MGLFDSFKKEKPKVTLNVTGPVIVNSNKEFAKNSIKTSRGLTVGEVLLLFYCQKGSYPVKEGKQYPAFWENTYGIKYVEATLRKLQTLGFIKLSDKGKYELTDLGKAEAADNEYVDYMHKHKNLPVSVWDMNVLTSQHPERSYKDLLWGELNRLLLNYSVPGKEGLYRNAKYQLANISIEDGRYMDALRDLSIVCFYDLNNESMPRSRNPEENLYDGIIKDLYRCAHLLGITPETMFDQLMQFFATLPAYYRTLSNRDTAIVIINKTFGK